MARAVRKDLVVGGRGLRGFGSAACLARWFRSLVALETLTADNENQQSIL